MVRVAIFPVRGENDVGLAGSNFADDLQFVFPIDGNISVGNVEYLVSGEVEEGCRLLELLPTNFGGSPRPQFTLGEGDDADLTTLGTEFYEGATAKQLDVVGMSAEGH